MEHLFVDTTYLVARFNRRDRHHRAVEEFIRARGEPGAPRYRFVTSDYVFDEVITTLLFRSGRHDEAASAGAALRGSEAVEILHVDESTADDAWALFLDRPDKLWSFTDCVSFVLMDRLGIRSALSFDRNFREAGFATLP